MTAGPCFVGYRANGCRPHYVYVPADKCCYVHANTGQWIVTDDNRLTWPWIRSYPQVKSGEKSNEI